MFGHKRINNTIHKRCEFDNERRFYLHMIVYIECMKELRHEWDVHLLRDTPLF